MQVRLIPLLILFLIVACSNTEDTSGRNNEPSDNTTAQKKNSIYNDTLIQQNKSCSIPDSNMFMLKQVDKTISKEDVFTVRQFKNLSREQVKSWLAIPQEKKYPIETDFKYFKAVSFQKETPKYYSILLMMVSNITEDYLIGEEQVLVTTDKSGKYIDGLPVSYLKNLGNFGAELDTARRYYIFSTEARSKFSGDTIKVYELMDISQKAENEPRTDKDIWQELYETIYLIQPDGKIAMIRERKKIKEEHE